MSQPRYNPRTQRDDWYYRIKESSRDLTGRVRSRVMLNVGFIDEPHRPEDIRGNQEWCPGFQSIYKVAPSLYELKDKLESHLCRKMDDLFNITNRIAVL